MTSLQCKVEKLKEILKEKQESFAVLEDCLEKQREADLTALQSLDFDDNEEVSPDEGVTEGIVSRMQ